VNSTLTRWGLIAAGLAACYASFLVGMAQQWWTDEDMGQGFLVPVVVTWIVWRERQQLRAMPWQPSAWGLGFLALGGLLHAAAALGGGLFAGCLAFLISLAGVVVWLGGLRLLRALAFPFLLTLFMLPKLAVVYNQVTLPLQLLASRLAAAGVASVGLGVLRDGNILQVNGHRVAVEEACNGIRYLLPLGFIALVYGYISGARPCLRAALLAASVPLAILGNALRVAAAAVSPVLDAGAPHMVAGWLVFVICLTALMATRWLLGRVFERVHV
jgi:exosortase